MKRLVTALDLARDALVTLDSAGIVEHLNHAAEGLVGVERTSIVGQSVTAMFDTVCADGVHSPAVLVGALAGRCASEGMLKPRGAGDLLRYELVRDDGGGGVLRLARDTRGALEGVGAILRPVMYDSRSDDRHALENDDRFLHELAGLLVDANDSGKVLADVAKHVGSYLGVSRCTFYGVSVADNELVVHPGHELDEPSVAGTYTLDALSEETRAWLLEGRIIVTSDARTDPRTRARYESAYAPINIRATVNVPLMRSGVCVAAISVTSSTPRSFTARDIALLDAVASKTWLAIEQCRADIAQATLVEQLVNQSAELERRVELRTAELTQSLAEREALLVERDQAAEQLRLTIEASPTGILMVSDDGEIAMVNAHMESTFGYARPELVGQRVDRLFESRPAIAAGDAIGIRSDGTRIPVHVALNPFVTARGRFVLASVLDIADRVAADRALRENEDRYRRLFHDSPTALCEQDFSKVRLYLDELVASGVTDLVKHLRAHPGAVTEAAKRIRFVEVNDATLEIYEAASREEILTNWPSLFDREMARVFMEQLCFLIEGRPSTFMARAVTRTLKGRRNEIEFRLTVLPGSEKTWERLVASIFDMTAYLDAERKLRAALREKDVLLKEVHHRVKNNLQVISSLLNLQAHYVEDPVARAVFASSQSRIQSIALVHEKLYQAENLSHVRLAEYLETLISELLSAHSAAERGISSVVEVADLSLSVDVAIPCGLIVNELVTNALKHAFGTASSGTVTIKAQRSDEHLIELSVTDDGRGLPPAVDHDGEHSLGLDLVFTFAEQLGADVQITRTGGTGFIFRFREEAA